MATTQFRLFTGALIISEDITGLGHQLAEIDAIAVQVTANFNQQAGTLKLKTVTPLGMFVPPSTSSGLFANPHLPFNAALGAINVGEYAATFTPTRLEVQVATNRRYSVQKCGNKEGPNGRKLAEPRRNASAALIYHFHARIDAHRVKRNAGGWQPFDTVTLFDGDNHMMGRPGQVVQLYDLTFGCIEPLAGEEHMYEQWIPEPIISLDLWKAPQTDKGSK